MKVIGLDCNTKSIGYGVLENNQLIDHGLLMMSGKDRNERAKSAYEVASKLFGRVNPDLVVIEDAVFVQNQSALIALAFTFGAIVAAAPVKAVSARPLEWQNLIGNKVLSAAQKQRVKDLNPGKSETWYRNAYRLQRKNYTREWVNQNYGVDIDQDDVTDAIGLSYWGQTKHGS